MEIRVLQRLREYAQRHPTAASSLAHFEQNAKAAAWGSFNELKRTFNHADQCLVKSGRIVQIINIQGNRYRLVVSTHFNKRRIYIREFLSHAEYSKGNWKHRH
jgi:mRNA interferase HigB